MFFYCVWSQFTVIIKNSSESFVTSPLSLKNLATSWLVTVSATHCAWHSSDVGLGCLMLCHFLFLFIIILKLILEWVLYHISISFRPVCLIFCILFSGKQIFWKLYSNWSYKCSDLARNIFLLELWFIWRSTDSVTLGMTERVMQLGEWFHNGLAFHFLSYLEDFICHSSLTLYVTHIS